MKSYQYVTDVGVIHIRCSDRSDGSFALDEPEQALTARRASLLGAGREWIGLRQVHGAEVHDPRAHAQSVVLPEADAAVSFDPGFGVSVLSADCAPVVLVGSTGVAVVHAGWRGAAAGVITAAAERLRCAGAEPVAVLLGPCIQPEAYEFGASDLEPIVAAFGSEIVGRSAAGTTALDLTRVVQISCERAGWPIPDRPACTSSAAYYSHRTRADIGRQATVAWIEREDGLSGPLAERTVKEQV